MEAEVDFDGLVDLLVRSEELPEKVLPLLSDLDHDRSRLLNENWSRVPEGTRLTLVSEAALLAENEVGYSFEQLMVGALEDSNRETRKQAAAALIEATSRHAASRLSRVLQEDEEPSVRCAAASALAGFVGDWATSRSHVEALAGILDGLRDAAIADSSVEVRARALVSAAGSNEGWVAPVLEESYYGDDRVLRLAAVEAMGQTCDDRWLEYLFEQLESDDSDFRTESAAAIGELGLAEGLQALASAVEDETPEVSEVALLSIVAIGGSVAMEVLTDLRADLPANIGGALLDAAMQEVEEGFLSSEGQEPG